MSDFYIRKLKTYFASTDFDKDGVLTEKDYRGMVDRFAEIVKLNPEQVAEIRKAATKIWEVFHKGATTDGKSLTQDQLIESIKKRRNDPAFKDTIKDLFSLEFHYIDTNKDGFIQLDEYEVFFKCRGIDTAAASASFKAIDSNHDGVISLEEFTSAAIDFFVGDDENSPSRLFWGPLV